MSEIEHLCQIEDRWLKVGPAHLYYRIAIFANICKETQYIMLKHRQHQRNNKMK